MLDTFSKDIVYTKMLPPYTQTLFVELVRFSPGQPELSNSSTPTPRSAPMPMMPRTAEPGPSTHHRHSHIHSTPIPLPTPPTPVYELARQPSTNGHHVPPPPPWSTQWHSLTSSPLPPRGQPQEQSRPQSPHLNKKRKYVDDSPQDNPEPRSPKQRRLPQTPVLPSASAGARVMQQALSPSLAMIVSPVDTEPSPRRATSIPPSYARPSSSSSLKSMNGEGSSVKSVKLFVGNHK